MNAYRGQRVLWIAVFVAFFALSLDYWNWHDASLGLFGLPSWLWYFVLLQFAFAGAMVVFCVRYWKSPNEEKVDG